MQPDSGQFLPCYSRINTVMPICLDEHLWKSNFTGELNVYDSVNSKTFTFEVHNFNR